MKTYFTIINILFFVNVAFTQDDKETKNNDVFRITIATVIPDDLPNPIPTNSIATIKNKMTGIITKNGIGNSEETNQFQLVVNPTISNQKVVANAPVFVLTEFDLNLYLIDAFNKNILASESILIKGSGKSENESFLTAFRSISNKDINAFLEKGKKKIVEYYARNCSIVIKKAIALEEQDNLNESLAYLASIPDANEECFDKVIAEIKRIRLKNVNLECKDLITKAKITWQGNQNLAGAKEASKFLMVVPRSEACYTEIDAILKEIKAKLNSLEIRDWEFQMKQWSSEVEIEKLYIQAHRDVGTAYGNNQPQTITNFKGWLY